jgi:hypothetical protein
LKPHHVPWAAASATFLRECNRLQEKNIKNKQRIRAVGNNNGAFAGMKHAHFVRFIRKRFRCWTSRWACRRGHDQQVLVLALEGVVVLALLMLYLEN